MGHIYVKKRKLNKLMRRYSMKIVIYFILKDIQNNYC